MRKEFLICLILVTCSAAFFGFNVGSLSYLKGDENYYFQVGRNMVIGGDWITPRYHHRIRFEKPPLYYWLVAVFFKLFGASWPVARLTSVLLGALTVLVTYLLALELFGRKEALFSALVLATNEIFFRYSRLCVSDITYICLLSFSLYLFIKSYAAKKDFYFIMSFVPLALASLVKGPVSVVIFFLTVIIFSMKYRVSNPALKIINLTAAVLIIAVLTLPWLIAMAKIHKELFLKHIWSVEIVNKTLLAPKPAKPVMETMWYYIKSFGYYVPVVLFSFLPWSLFLPFALFAKPARKTEGRWFVLGWFWSVFLFFSLVGFKHTHYMLALSPALAIIIGVYFSDVSLERPAVKKVFLAITVLSIVVLMSVVGFILPYLDDGGLRVFSLKIASEIEKDDRIGMASGRFNIKKLGMHFNNLISDTYQTSTDDLARYVLIDKKENLIASLKSDQRIFVLITKADYINYVPSELRNKLCILESHAVWKNFKFDANALGLILRRSFDELKEEAYLVSNKRRKK